MRKNPSTILQSALRARAYVRVSSVSRERAGNLISDAMQIDEARRYAEYLGMEFEETESVACADLDVSGFRLDWRKRPGLMRLLEAAKRGEFEVLIFYKLSRLSRRVRHALEIIDEFERYGVSFHFVSEKIDSGSAQGRFLRNVLLSAAEMQAEDISDFVKASQKRAAMSGKLHGSLPAWLRKNEAGEIEIFEPQAAAMRRLVELRIAGKGQVAIARILNKEGHRASTGAYWNQSHVHKYLREDWIQSLRGTAFYGRRREDAIAIPNAFPAIITEEEAEQLALLQKLYRDLHGAGSKRSQNGRTHAGGKLLSGILFCPYCGSSMHMSSANDKKKRAGQKVLRYVCYRRVALRDLHPMGAGSVVDYAIEDAVLRVVRHALAWPLDPVEPDEPRKSTPDFAKLLADVQLHIDKLVEMNLRGRLSDEDFSRHYDGLLSEKARIQAADLEANQPDYMRLAQILSQRGELNEEELRQLVLIMVEKVEANVTVPGQRLRTNLPNPLRFARVTLRFPTSRNERTFLARQYRSYYEGEKTIVHCEAPILRGVVQIAPEEFGRDG